MGTPPTPQGILKKKPFFFFLYALETTKIRHTLRNLLRPWGPCPYHLPPRNRSPCITPEPLPRLPDSPSTSQLRGWVFSLCLATTYPPGTEALAPPPEPLPRLPDPPSTKPAPWRCSACQANPSWNQGPWSTPPSTRPAPVGTPPTPQGILQKKPFFFFFVRVRNNKNTTHVAKFAPSPPPEPKPLHLPPSPCPASLTPRPPSQLCGCPFCQAPSLTPLPGIKALGLPPRPPGQLRWVPPPPHRASFK